MTTTMVQTMTWTMSLGMRFSELAGPAVMCGVAKRLKVSKGWVDKHAPAIESLDAPTPVGTPWPAGARRAA